MGNIASAAELKNAIQLLEADKRQKGQELKEQFNVTYRSLKPLNLIASTIKEVVTSPSIIESLIVGGLGLATGYFTKRIVVGTTTNIFRKLLGSALQFGATSVVSKNADSIKTAGKFISTIFSRKKNK
jgi:hypothetical protein